MKSTTAAMIFALIAATSTLARAESTAHALEAFGLVGTWSTDCAKDDLLRVTYTLSALGSSTVTLVVPNSKETFDIDSAVRITDEKLKIIKHASSSISNGKLLTPGPKDKGVSDVSVLLKSGSKYRVLDAYITDGKELVTIVKNGMKFAPKGVSLCVRVYKML